MDRIKKKSKQPPSKTAGTIKLFKALNIEEVFEAMKEPYDTKSLLGYKYFNILSSKNNKKIKY